MVKKRANMNMVVKIQKNSFKKKGFWKAENFSILQEIKTQFINDEEKVQI